MVKRTQKYIPTATRVKTPAELGQVMREFRKSNDVTLQTMSGLSTLSMRFLSELERGKETAELGKALKALNLLGLEVVIQPRGFSKKSGTDEV